MPNNKIEAVITIAKIGEKDNKFWVKDQSGEFYSGFKEYQGTQNNEYAQLILGNHGEPFKEGQQALITFTKTAGTDKTGKDVIYKNLKGIYPAEGSQTAPQAKSSNTGQSVRSGEVSRDEFSRRLGIQGHLNALLSNPNLYGGKDILGYSVIVGLAIQIEDELEKQLNPSPVRKALEKTNPNFFKQELPTIQQDDPTDGELNPMVNDEPPLEDGPGFGDEDWKFER